MRSSSIAMLMTLSCWLAVAESGAGAQARAASPAWVPASPALGTNVPGEPVSEEPILIKTRFVVDDDGAECPDADFT